jgi:acyl-CoA dehydrogenase
MSGVEFLDWPFFEPSHRTLRADLEEWAREALRWSEPDDVDGACRHLVAELARGGWLRHAVCGREFGAAQDTLDVRALCLIRETLAYHHALADFAFAMQGLGAGPVSLFGTPEQRRRYLPRVAAGQSVAAFALTEPEAGSDAAALQCEARRADGGYLLNGRKTFVSNGGIADFYVVFARTGEGPGARGISAFLVDADTPGLEVVERIQTSAPHPLATLRLRDCWVPDGQRVGAPGDGFRIAMRTLDVFRTTVAAAAVGFARRALDEALGRALQRRLFGGLLVDLQLTQARLADMASRVDASALLTYRAAWLHDRGVRAVKEAAMAKMVATENAQHVVDAAVQLWGGLGVTRGTVVESLYRHVRALRIYEGATEVQQLVVARELVRGRQPGPGQEGGEHGADRIRGPVRA